MKQALLPILFFVPTLLQAQESTTEITAFGAYRFGGTFEEKSTEVEYELNDSSSFGLILNLPHRADTQWEIFYSYQDTEADFQGGTASVPRVDIEQHVLQLGGTYQWDGEVARPYLALTVGGTHIKADSSGSESDTFFSGSIGIGMKFLPTSRVGIRVEARAYGTFVDNNTDLFCSTGPDANVCAIRLTGRTLTQVETFAGITVRF